MKWICVMALALCGCAGVTEREAGFGYSTDGDNHVGSLHYGEYKQEGFGFLTSIGLGGEFPESEGDMPNNPLYQPGGSSSEYLGTTTLAGGLTLAGTYMINDRFAVYGGASAWLYQDQDTYHYDGGWIAGEGTYRVDGDDGIEVGGVLGVKMFLPDEGGTLGFQYDTALEMFGISLGFTF